MKSDRTKNSWSSLLLSIKEANPDMKEQSIQEIISEFCQETSFHAIQFFTKKGLSPIKRLFWVLCWLTSLTACLYYIVICVSELKATPTITSIDSTNYPINRLEFPSVTFCNFNHIVKGRNPPRQEDILGRVKFSDEQWTNLTKGVYKNIFTTEPIEELVNSSVLQLTSKEVHCLIKKSAQKCEDMVLLCLWKGTHDCTNLFKQVATKYGFCCTINHYTNRVQNDNTPDYCPVDHAAKVDTNKYKKNFQVASPTAFDKIIAGMTLGLAVVLDAQVYEYSYSTFHSIGFKVHLRVPDGPTGIGVDTVVLTPARESFVFLRAHSTYTTKAALALKPQERKCYLRSEGVLKNYKHTYFPEACTLDYQNTILQEECGCQEYYFPGNGDICFTQEQIACSRNATEKWQMDPVLQEQVSNICLPNCNMTWYVATPSYSSLPSQILPMTWLGLKFLHPILRILCEQGEVAQLTKKIKVDGLKGEAVISNQTAGMLCAGMSDEELENLLNGNDELLHILMDYIRENVALGHFFFEQSTATLYKRDVITTDSQIVANIGGLMGLFLGFSLLSGAEILFCAFEIVSRFGISCFKKTYQVFM